jgi:hypothetical protein
LWGHVLVFFILFFVCNNFCYSGGMYVKITTSGPRRYVQLIESFRDDDGRVKKRTVATLGRADQLSGELDSVIDGLLKVAGREPAKSVPAISGSSLTFESARALGVDFHAKLTPLFHRKLTPPMAV